MTTSRFRRRDFVRLGAWAAAGRAADSRPPGKSCIFLWQRGGASHLDTFDPKPGAPLEIRGEFRAIATTVPGLRISEHLPLTARLGGRLVILRSMHSEESNHERALRYMETGHRLRVAGDGARGARIANTAAPAGRDLAAYGDTDFGRACWRARVLVETGARLVHVAQRGYDTHEDNFRRLRDWILPEFDRAYSTLLSDLDARGLLDTTLVVATGEFGRSPRINERGGRDHHPGAWSVVLAGAGLEGGRVVGATDATGSEVVDTPVRPEDLARTVAAILNTEAGTPVLAGRIVKELLV